MAASSEWTTWDGTISVEVPPDWYAKESITMLEPAGRANLIFSSEPISSEIDGRKYAEAQQDLLREEFPGWTPLGDLEPYPMAGLEEHGWLRDFAWEPSEGRRIRQIQIYGAYQGRGWTATATAEIDDFATLEEILLEAMSLLVVRRSSRSESA